MGYNVGMEDNIMALSNISRYRVEAVDVNAVDADTLFAIAEHYGFPAIPLWFPDYSAHIEIAGTRKAWEYAVRYLEEHESLGINMLKFAYLKMWDWFASFPQPKDYQTKTPIMVSSLFNNSLVLDEANKKFSHKGNLNPCSYYRVCAMLAHAEARNFPEITIHHRNHNYTIHGDMESWVNAAKWFYTLGDEICLLAIQKLMELDASGNPLAPTDNTTHSNGGSTPVLIDITDGGVFEWH
jgi:hypothetical protein